MALNSSPQAPTTSKVISSKSPSFQPIYCFFWAIQDQPYVTLPNSASNDRHFFLQIKKSQAFCRYEV